MRDLANSALRGLPDLLPTGSGDSRPEERSATRTRGLGRGGADIPCIGPDASERVRSRPQGKCLIEEGEGPTASEVDDIEACARALEDKKNHQIM